MKTRQQQDQEARRELQKEAGIKRELVVAGRTLRRGLSILPKKDTVLVLELTDLDGHAFVVAATRDPEHMEALRRLGKAESAKAPKDTPSECQNCDPGCECDHINCAMPPCPGPDTDSHASECINPGPACKAASNVAVHEWVEEKAMRSGLTQPSTT